ncbi:hypothetical protein CS062_02255 [Roseateles chitinivorans]|uniref:Uncharacterized protein n=1 Tax=Roseateles chitinivorans TaxID=2917965 RepID=A0A2G9CE89_9BURK|nr:hypothetical protein CS062_02255 [Roseateles chitinivorans]
MVLLSNICDASLIETLLDGDTLYSMHDPRLDVAPISASALRVKCRRLNLRYGVGARGIAKVPGVAGHIQTGERESIQLRSEEDLLSYGLTSSLFLPLLGLPSRAQVAGQPYTP